MKIIILLIILLLANSTLLLSQIVSYDIENYYVSTNNFDIIINNVNGMIESAKLKNISFEIVTDKSNYSLMFPEFYPEDPTINIHNAQFHYPPIGSNIVLSYLKANTDTIAIINFDWNTQYIRTKWSYKFIENKPFFIVDIEREVNKSYVYSNAQQCLMFSSDFDDSYIVAYNGELLCTMENNNPTGYLASSQHSMFSAIDEGLTNIFPMLAWHEDGYNIVGGIICPYVSPNQRKTMSYHGGGSTHSHPGYAEGQFNWFGKSDTESIFLKKGLSYSMQLYYYLNQCSISKLMDFNSNLFNDSCYELKKCKNYWAASYGARTSVSENYFCRFPQASSNYICSQELFRPRAFSIPCSQNGLRLRDTHIFNLYVKQNSFDNFHNLTPIYGTEPLFDEAETIIVNDHMIGIMSWSVNSLSNELRYKVYEGSDKVLVSGQIKVLEQTSIKELFVELELSPRVSEIFSVGDSIFDIRCDDEVYEKIGITVYDLQNIEEIIVNDDHIRFYLVKNLSDSLYSEGDSFEYSFSLFPHIGYNVEGYDNITPLISAPEEYYREYYLTFPDQLGNNKYGICPNLNIFPYNAIIGSDSLIFSLDIFCNQGYYPIKIFIDEPKIESVVINNEELLTWNFNEITRVLTLEKDWSEANYKIKIYNKKIHGLLTEPYFQIFPNPFKNSTYISFEFPEQVNYEINIYNIKGQLIKNFSGLASKESLLWNRKDNNNELVSNGIYLCELKVTNYCRTKKILLFNK